MKSSILPRQMAALLACTLGSFFTGAALLASPALPVLPTPPPAAPTTHLNVMSSPYNAKGDGSTKDTGAFQAAINAATAMPGGAVIDVPGTHTYLIGSIDLKSNVWLNLESGATIKGSESTSDYPVVTERWEGQDDPCYRGLISATGTPTNPVVNIAIIGSGKIVGASGGINLDRPKSPVGPKNIEPRYCKGVYIQGITTSTTKIWNIHPTYCQDVTVSGVTTTGSQSNSDGCDPDSCSRVLIDSCHFGSGDDDIAVKSGRGIAGAQVNIPMTDLTIQNCTFTSCGGASGGVAFGSEISGGIERVLVKNNKFTFTGSNQKAIYIKYAHGRGGFVNDLTVDGTTTACQALKIESNYSNQDYGPYGNGPISGLPGISQVNNFVMTNTHETGGTALAVLGDPAKLVNNISIASFTTSGSIGSVTNVTNFTFSGSPAPSKSNVIAGITTSADSATVSPGGVATFTVTVPAGLSGPVGLSIVGDGIGNQLPAGTTASFSPSSLSSGSGSSTLTFTTSSSTPPGMYSENIQALNSGGSIAWTAAVTLVVSGNSPPQVAAPSFNPGGGTYSSPQLISVTLTTSGATGRYTTDGSDPSETHGTLIGGPISITSTTTLKAIAYESGFADSNITTEVYTITTPQAAAPVFNPGGGNYPNTQNVSMTSNSGASIRYTTDGSTPTETNGTIYSGPVNISSNTLLQAIAFESGFADSSVNSATYTIGMVSGPIMLEAENLSPVGTGATASTGTDANASGGILEFLNSTGAGQSITFTTPNISAGTYQLQMRERTNTNRGQFTTKVDGTQIGGTIDEYAATAGYVSAMPGTVTLATSGAHTIVLTVTGKNSASSGFILCVDTFTLTPQTSGPPLAGAPSFSPAGGTYTTTQTVTISTTTGGASIRYTTDGSTPSETAGTL
ncbi:MAG TPA: chitobiase/beta-hexosaminidase C-terminal domain-containing protein, partial [Opitutaceae bacterium]|nr:chitobiase/beta-hexosaminidase C-terminal domain-containing protein [Opitutaceae bacterium]